VNRRNEKGRPEAAPSLTTIRPVQEDVSAGSRWTASSTSRTPRSWPAPSGSAARPDRGVGHSRRCVCAT